MQRALAQVMENRFKKADEDLQQAAKAVLEGAYTGPQQADILSWAGTFSHLRNDLEKAKTVRGPGQPPDTMSMAGG